jgi:hypothetical protein
MLQNINAVSGRAMRRLTGERHKIKPAKKMASLFTKSNTAVWSFVVCGSGWC